MLISVRCLMPVRGTWVEMDANTVSCVGVVWKVLGSCVGQFVPEGRFMIVGRFTPVGSTSVELHANTVGRVG